MKSAKFPPLTWSKAAFTALSLLAAFGCSEPSEPGDSVAALLNDGWTWCAVQGDRCTFAGTRQVQFGAGAQFVARSFTDGVVCSSSAFGVSFGSGNACYVLLSEAEQSAHVHTDDSQSANTEPSHDAQHVSGAVENVSQPPQTSLLLVAVAFLILFGIGWGFFDSNNMPILCQVVRPELRATGYGIMNLVSISCGGLADWGFGILRDRHVPIFGIFSVFASAAIVSIVLVLLIRPRYVESTAVAPAR